MNQPTCPLNRGKLTLYSASLRATSAPCVLENTGGWACEQYYVTTGSPCGFVNCAEAMARADSECVENHGMDWYVADFECDEPPTYFTFTCLNVRCGG